MIISKRVVQLLSACAVFVIVTATSGTSSRPKIEKPCLCQQFRCNEGSFCLHKSRVCNGYPDCPGGEEEMGYSDKSCFKRVTKCDPKKEFKCKFGGCVNLTQVCDGRIDCFGGVDEASDFCAWVFGETDVRPVT